jgi:hypothetical protein
VNNFQAKPLRMSHFWLTGGIEIAGFLGLQNLAISFLRFPFWRSMILSSASEGHDKTQEAQDDGFELDLFRARLDRLTRSSTSSTSFGVARRPDRLGRRRDRTALQREGAARGPDAICDRAVAAQADLRGCRTKACANAGSMTPVSSTSPEEFFQG